MNEKRDPEQARREGLEEIQKPHHPTTHHHDTNVAVPPVPPVIETPGEKHRGGPLPYEKK